MSTITAPIANATPSAASTGAPVIAPSTVIPGGVVDLAEIDRQLAEMEAQKARLLQAKTDAEHEAAAKKKANLLAGLELIGIKSRADVEAVLIEAFGPAAPTAASVVAQTNTASSKRARNTPVTKARKSGATTKRAKAVRAHGRGSIPAEVKAKVIELLKAGHTDAEVAKATKVSLPSVANYKRDAGLAGIGLGGRERVTLQQLVDQGKAKPELLKAA